MLTTCQGPYMDRPASSPTGGSGSVSNHTLRNRTQVAEWHLPWYGHPQLDHPVLTPAVLLGLEELQHLLNFNIKNISDF